MKPILVTGATGFVGWHVACQLVKRGYRVRALVRDPQRLRELDVEAVQGDLRDRDSVSRAVRGCVGVFHVAADYRLWVRNASELYESNVEGTRHVLGAALAEGVERTVYTSTVGCIAVPSGGIGDEQLKVSLDEMTGDYKRSKFLAERVAEEMAGRGLQVIIVNPTAPIGDHDFKPTPTGKIILDFIRGAMPAYVDTGLNLVDVRDVAQGHLLAYERGQSGERYILGCENLTLQQIFQKLQSISGQRAPTVRIPYAIAWTVGAISTAWANLTGMEPRAPLDAVRMSRNKMFVSSEKAEREIGYKTSPVEDALRRAVEWFRANRNF